MKLIENNLLGFITGTLIGVLIVVMFGECQASCNEDDLTDYSAHHLLVVCTPVKYGYVQNPYYKGTEKCGVIDVVPTKEDKQ